MSDRGQPLIPPATAILMYHYVRPPDAPCRVGAGAVDLVTFGSQLDDLAASRTIVGWSEVASGLLGEAALPDDACLLTFDDGHDDHHRYVLPMLAERGLPAVFFVMARDPAEGLTAAHRIHVLLALMTPDELREAVVDGLPAADRAHLAAAEERRPAEVLGDPVDALKWVLQRDLLGAAGPVLSSLVERLVGPEPDLAAALHLDEGQLRDLAAAGMALGGHTHGHRWLDHISGEDVAAEVKASVAQLRRLAPEGGWPFAYPYGAPPPRPEELLPRLGFPAAFVATGRGRSDRYRLGRVDAESLPARPSAALAALTVPADANP